MSSRVAAYLLSGTALLASTLPAWAIEPDAAADALGAAMIGSGSTEASYDSASEDGGDIVIENLSFARGEEGTMTFGEVVIEAPTEGGEGVFESPSITFTDGQISGESTGSIENVTISDAIVLEVDDTSGQGPAENILFSSVEATNLAVERADQPGEVTVDRIYVEAGNVVDNVPQESSGSVEGLTIPPEAFADAAMTPATLGYENLALDVTWDGTRDVEAQEVTVRDFTVSIQDGGSFTVTGVLGNLPEPSQLNDPDASAQAAEMELHTITLRYEDDSLTGRVLDMLAEQQGITREDYVNQIVGALPFLLAALNNQEFQNEVSEALGTFLQDPQSLTLTLAPDAPISGSEIMGLAGTAPQSIPDRLNASVTANTAE